MTSISLECDPDILWRIESALILTPHWNESLGFVLGLIVGKEQTAAVYR